MVIEPKEVILARQAKAFKLLTMARAWHLRKGSATIHFDAQGEPTTVEVRSFTYGEVMHTPKGGNDLTIVI